MCDLTGDSAAPCGADCCSWACGPYAPTGVSICQHASGCRPSGDLCVTDRDCCGQVCDRGQPADTFGVCAIILQCKPNGTVCRAANTSCNAETGCCSGDTLSNDTCKPDNVGVTRCTGAQCVGAGQACSSSADCCAGWPCVPNPAAADSGAASFVCYSSSCVPACGGCTNDADCCGGACHLPLGSAAGVCLPCNHT